MAPYTIKRVFRNRVLSIDVICEKASTLCGYPVEYILDEESNDGLYDYFVAVRFKDFEKTGVIMYADCESVNICLDDKFSNEMGGVFPLQMQKYDGRYNRQSVCITGFLFKESVLIEILLQALSHFDPLPDLREEFEVGRTHRLTNSKIEHLYSDYAKRKK